MTPMFQDWTIVYKHPESFKLYGKSYNFIHISYNLWSKSYNF